MITNVLYLFSIIFIVSIQSKTLSKVKIGLKPYQYQYVDSHNEDKQQLVYSEAEANYQSQNIANTAFLAANGDSKTKRKSKRRKTSSKKKPTKMQLRRIFKTRLITTTQSSTSRKSNNLENEINVELTTTVINLAPIYDRESGITYSQEDLRRICGETVQMSRNFGISDINTFAKNNCFLIRLYYPQVTCSQINQLIDYCILNGLMNG